MVSSLLAAVATCGAAAFIFFFTFLVVSGIWHEMRRLDHEPKWYATRLLVSCNMLRTRKRYELVHPKTFAELCMIVVAIIYLAIGTVNLAAGLVSVNLVAIVRDQTCAYTEEMESMCKMRNCSLACGSINFQTCGYLMCDPKRCSAELGDFLQAPGDAPSIAAAKNFRDLDGQLVVIQAIASIFGTASSLLLLAIPSMIAAYRTDKVALTALMYLSLLCTPICLAFAILIASYGKPLCEPCIARSESLAYRCDTGLNEGYWNSLCQVTNVASTDQCSVTLFLSIAALAAEGVLGACAMYFAQQYRIVFHVQAAYRRSAEAMAMSHAGDAETEAAPAGHQLGAHLVTKDDYMRFPGLLKLYRGHENAVLCVLIAPLRVGDESQRESSDNSGRNGEEPERLITGGLDGTIRVWDLVKGTCLSTWRAAGPVNALCVFRCKGPMRAQHRQPTVPLVNGRAEWPEHSGQFFHLPSGDQIALWIRVFRCRPDVFRAKERAGRAEGTGAGSEEGQDGGGKAGSGSCHYMELVGGCYFVLSEAIKVAVRGRAGIFAQNWWRLRDRRRVRSWAGRPASHFEDAWDEMPAVEAGGSSEPTAIEEEQAGWRLPGKVLVTVEVQEEPPSKKGQKIGGTEEDEDEKAPRWPRLFVCVRQLELAKGMHTSRIGTEVMCVVEAQAIGRQRVFSASGVSITMWDTVSGRAEAVFPSPRPPVLVTGHRLRVTCVAVARLEGRERLFSGSIDGSIIMWDVFSGACVWKTDRHVDSVTSLCLAPLLQSEPALVEALALEEQAMLMFSVELLAAEEGCFNVHVRVMKAEGLPPIEQGGGCNALVRGEHGDQVQTTSVRWRTRSPDWPPTDVGENLVFTDVTRSDEIMLKVLSKNRSGALSYMGHVRLKVNDIYNLCLPGDMVMLPPAADAVFSKDPGTRILQARWWPLDHSAPRGAELYSGGGSTDCRVLKWDVASGNILRCYPRDGVAGGTREGHGSAVTGLVVADAYGVRRLFSASHDGTIRIWHPYTSQRLKIIRHSAEIADLAVSSMPDSSVRTFAALLDGTAVMTRVETATLTKVTWRSELIRLLDSPNAFGVVAVAILVDLSAGLADFTAPENTKDCFGRDKPVNTIITITVLSIFFFELLARMVALGQFFWVPLDVCKWNYFEATIILASTAIAVYKAASDFTMEDLPLKAQAEPGRLYPIVSQISNPDICLQSAANVSGGVSGVGVAPAVVQKGFTTLRIVSRVAVGLRVLRVALKAARIASSLLSRIKPAVFDGHEKGLHALALGRLRGEIVMATACDDGYARLWDATGLLHTLQPPQRGKKLHQWWQLSHGMNG